MRKKRNRLSGSSLLITVVIALVMGLICSLFILSAYQDLRLRTDRDIENRLNRNLQSAINMALVGSPAAGYQQIRELDLFGTGRDSVLIRESTWGVYDFACVEARMDGRYKHRNLLFGPLLGDSLDGCLYLAEHQRSLSLVGDTRLTGKAYLPKGGIRPGYIDQRGYDHSDLVNGLVEKSGNTLPDIDVARLSYYEEWFKEDFVAGLIQEGPDSLTRSFSDTVLTLHRNGPVFLNGVKYAGHIVVGSDSLIEVAGNTVLDGVLLIAPVIRFRTGFSGKLQAFGTDSIIVERSCHMSYPSALVLVKKVGKRDQPRLIVEDSSVVEGLVLTSARDDETMNLLVLKKGSIIKGIVYSNGFLSPGGSVCGTVLTDYLIYRGSGMVYENYLVDSRIDRGALRDYFVGPSVFNYKKKNKIIQWLD